MLHCLWRKFQKESFKNTFKNGNLSFVIHSFTDGHVGCFQHLAIVNWAAMKGDNGGKKGKSHQGTCITDPWTKTMGEEDWMWEVGVGKMGESNGGEMGTSLTEQQL